MLVASDSKFQPGIQDVRNLSSLADTASTSRVLNLTQIHATSAKDPGYRVAPFFHNVQLNKSMVVKHTVRPHEREYFARPRRTATKIILPFDTTDLKLGGRAIFVDQIGFDTFAATYFGDKDIASNPDVQVLRCLDDIPSLDPFLVREHLARHGFRPAPCYLKISPYDLQAMVSYANAEIQRLVLKASGAGMEAGAVRLTTKILADTLDRDLEPLKNTFKLGDDDFAEGMFSWRGFLYFKWRQRDLQAEVNALVEDLTSYRTVGPADDGTKAYLAKARPRLARKIAAAMTSTQTILNVYDLAYRALTEGSNPAPFRAFLVKGPSMFFALGESLGILSHIGAFWSYRMGGKGQSRLTAAELADILVDFEDSLMGIETSLIF